MLRSIAECRLGAAWACQTLTGLISGRDRLVVESQSAGAIARQAAGLRWNLIYLEETTSTNDELRRLAQAGAPEGTAVIAGHQTAGRGRFGRRWETPRGAGLLLSILFRPALMPERIHQLAMICGLASLDAIERELGLYVGLKWPNDIVCGGLKLGGILAEGAIRGQQVEHVVVGIGLNVNLDPACLPAGLAHPATSLSRLVGRPVDQDALLRAFLSAASVRYAGLQRGDSFHLEWASRLEMLQEPVTVWGPGDAWTGIAETVDPSGALLVRVPDGSLRCVRTEDVSPGTRVSWQTQGGSAIMPPAAMGE